MLKRDLVTVLCVVHRFILIHCSLQVIDFMLLLITY